MEKKYIKWILIFMLLVVSISSVIANQILNDTIEQLQYEADFYYRMTHDLHDKLNEALDNQVIEYVWGCEND